MWAAAREITRATTYAQSENKERGDGRSGAGIGGVIGGVEGAEFVKVET